MVPADAGMPPDHRKPADPAGPVLVLGYDRAPASQAALTVAADLAERLHARHLHVVHAVDLSDYPIDPDSTDWEQIGQRNLEEERDLVKTALAQLSVPWTYHLAHRAPARYLAALATKHDALMIIVGTRGEGFGAALSRLLGASVTHGLLHHGHRPVLIVPAPARERSHSRTP